MKKFAVIAVAASLFALTACESDNTNPSPGTPPPTNGERPCGVTEGGVDTCKPE